MAEWLFWKEVKARMGKKEACRRLRAKQFNISKDEFGTKLFQLRKYSSLSTTKSGPHTLATPVQVAHILPTLPLRKAQVVEVKKSKKMKKKDANLWSMLNDMDV